MRHSKVGSVMTADVVRAEYGTSFKEVARLLAAHRISGLPVVDEDDKVIGVEVIDEVLVHALWLPPRSVEVSVTEGVVTPAGHLERKSETQIALSMTRRIDGVVDVVDQLTYRLDASVSRNKPCTAWPTTGCVGCEPTEQGGEPS
ncbi:CBS domain-containing protein [Streptomyces sp. NBC_00637]